MTQVLAARAGKITPEMEWIATQENVDIQLIQEGVATGKIVIPRNIVRKPFNYVGIGQGLRIKVNALIGTSSDREEMTDEVIKLKNVESTGCDAVMDLSTGGNIDGMRRLSLDNTNIPVGTVPIYQAAIEAIKKRGSIVAMTEEDMFETIEKQAADGVDFMAIHSAFNLETLNRLNKSGRITDVVSRGGSFLTGWMIHNEKENPLYEQFDRVLEILKKYDVTLSLGDAIRPGCTADSLDGAQLQGLIVAGELVARAHAVGVQVMVEGPGHVPMNHVEATMLLQKRLCNHAPYFILGTLATDIAPGYDHITSAIGGAIAGAAGADFLCYVTPAEHLGLPTDQDVKEGAVAARIAAHVADLARGNKKAWERDLQMANARVVLDFDRQMNLSIDPEKLRAIKGTESGDHHCTVCESECAAQIAAKYFGII
ncbi:MAG TPA: B12 lower ligand biosynthesis ThiC-like protein BzaB [Bacillota bacterium]|nr:B12 lower ligand biosynthesis ThiC-like protein BzaB [Bacillota bacterium]